MKVIFLGTPACGVPYLEALDALGAEVVAVITQPDRPSGRGRSLCAPPVKLAALERAWCVLQPPTCRDEGLMADLQALAPDIFLVVAFGQILCPQFLSLPRVAALNVHYSLLPQLRGAAPVQHALLQGLPETGVTLQHLAAELDAGDVVGQARLTIDSDDNAGTLTERLTRAGCDLVRDLLPAIMAGTAARVPQAESGVTWAPRLNKADGALDWNQPAAALHQRIRAMNPWPGAYCEVRGERLIVLEARLQAAGAAGRPGEIIRIEKNCGPVVATGSGALELCVVCPKGRKAMTGAEYLRGSRLVVGDRFGPGPG